MPEANNHIEKKLIQDLKKGDSSAFDELYQLYARRIYRFAFSFLKNKPDAEEIVQEVFIRVWENREKVKEYYSFRAFLFQIGYHIIIDKFREQLKEKEFIELLKANAVVSESDTDRKVDFADLNEQYRNEIENLPERRKTIYKMSRFDGLTYREIAEKLKISPKTVENQMVSALKHLRKKLGPETLLTLMFYYLFV